MKYAIISTLLALTVCSYSIAEDKTCGESCMTTRKKNKECSDQKQVKANKSEINTAALDAMISSGINMIILDARSGKFDDGRRIPGAKQMNPDVSEEQASKLIPSKDSLVVTYCSGIKCPASNQLANRLRALGYNNVLEYKEGIEGWVQAGKKVDKAN